MKLFGYEIKKAEPEPEVVDENGKPVGKPKVAEVAIGAVKTVAKIGMITGAAALAYTIGGNKTAKAKDEEIAKINKDRLELWADKADLEEKLQAALSKEDTDAVETEEDDDTEVVTF